MRLPISTSSKEMRLMREATTTRKVDYFHLPRPLWRKLKKCLPKQTAMTRRGGRPRASDRAVVNAIWYVLWTGCQWKALHRDWFGVSSSVVHERFQSWRRAGIFEKLMRRMAEYYARERAAMGLRDKVRQLERAASEDLESFILEDGSRFYYDPTSGERFLHSMDCLRAQGEGKRTLPAPPETIKAVTRARDRAGALNQLYPGSSFGVFPYDVDALLERGELVPRSMVAGRELGEVLEDLSE
jgi:transposase